MLKKNTYTMKKKNEISWMTKMFKMSFLSQNGSGEKNNT